jgi:LytR cell envelope-related transcriptional attenuator
VLVGFLLLFTLVDRLSGPDRPARGTASGATVTTASTTKRPTTTVAAPTTTTSRPTTSGPTTTAPATESTLRPASGVSVQVLNGVFVTGLARRVATRVRAAGYDVVAANTAFGNYSVSRIYFTGGHRADAEAFRDRFPDFQQIEPAPANLSRQVALHVVIGKNYSGV